MSDTSESFGRQQRLLVPKEFSEVFSARRVVRGERFALHYRPNSFSIARLGLVIPKKQARSAVLRNAIKRQARELFRRRCSGMPAVDLILRLTQPADRPKCIIGAETRVAWRNEMTSLFDQLCRKMAA